MKYLLFALVCSLTACAAPVAQPPVMNTQTVTVKEEVAVPCVKSIPAAPALLSDNDLLAGTGSQVADHMWVDHIERKDYIAQLLAILVGCTTLPPPDLSGPAIQ